MALNAQLTFSPLSELRPGHLKYAIRVYVSRIWHHRGGTDTGSIKHTDMVLLDTQGNHIYAEIPEKLVDQFMDMIKEGSIYDFRKFFVFPKKYVFRPVDGEAMIKFTKYTSVAERTGLDAEFPFCTYDLTSFDRLTNPSDMPQRFTDVLGVVSALSEAVQYHSSNRTEPSTKRIIRIKDLTGNELAINLWGQAATDFDGAGVMELGKTEPVIVIFVGTLVKSYDGRRALSGSAACRWYINEDFPDVKNFRRGLHGQLPVIESIHLPGQTAAEIDSQVNLQTLPLKELVRLDIFDNKDVRYYCTATLSKLRPGQRWWFPSCTICHKSAAQDGSAYRCSDPKCLGTDALPRYKLCFIAEDNGTEAEFVLFDRVGRELLGLPLITLLRHGHAPGASLAQIIDAARGDSSVPNEITSVLSRRFRFVVSLSNKCYGSEDGDVSFQVHRIDSVFQKQSHGPVSYHASSSAGDAGASSSSISNILPAGKPSILNLKPVSPDLTAYETMSPEDRLSIPMHQTPPTITKPSAPTPSSVIVTCSVRRNLFPPKIAGTAVSAAGSDAPVANESLSVKENQIPPDVQDIPAGSSLPMPEPVLPSEDKKKKSRPSAPEAASAKKSRK